MFRMKITIHMLYFKQKIRANTNYGCSVLIQLIPANQNDFSLILIIKLMIKISYRIKQQSTCKMTFHNIIQHHVISTIYNLTHYIWKPISFISIQSYPESSLNDTKDCVMQQYKAQQSNCKYMELQSFNFVHPKQIQLFKYKFDSLNIIAVFEIIYSCYQSDTMKGRYSSTRSKDKIKDHSRHDLSSTDKGINIQIFNITSRNRNKMLSTARRDNSVNFQQFLHIPSEEKIKRGASVFQRRPQDKHINLSNYGPVIPNYDIPRKKSAKDSNKKLKAGNASLSLASEANLSMNKRNFLQDEMGVEDLHNELVRFQQRCKNLIKK